MKNIDFKDKKIKNIIIISVVILIVVIIFTGNKIVNYVSNLKSKDVYVSNANGVDFHDELVENSGIVNVEFSTSGSNQDKCLDGICVDSVSLSCYDNRGVITYHVTNSTGEGKGEFLKLILGNNEYIATIYYTFTANSSITPGINDETGEEIAISGYDTNKEYYGYATYEDFDLTNIGKSYRIEALDEDDKNYGITYFTTNPQNGYYDIRPNTISSEDGE